MIQKSKNEDDRIVAALSHFFGNDIGIVRLWHLEGEMTGDFDSCKKDFIDGLEKALAENPPEYEGVTQQHLREMIQLAQSSDLRNIEHVEALCKKYFEIRQMPYNKQKLFPK